MPQLVFTPDGRRIAFAFHDREICLRLAQTGREERRLIGAAVSLSENGQFAFIRSYQNGSFLQDLMTGRNEPVLNMPPESQGFPSPDGKLLLVASPNAAPVLFDTRGKRQIGVLSADFGADTDRVIVSYTSDAQFLRIVDFNSLSIYAVQTGKRLKTIALGKANSGAAFAPMSDRVALITETGVLQFWDTKAGVQIGAELSLTGKISTVYQSAFSHDGRYLAVVRDDILDSAILVLDVKSRRVVTTLSGAAGDLAFSPNGKQLAVRGIAGKCSVYDLSTGKQLLSFSEADHAVLSLAFSPDGRTLAAADETARTRLIDTTTAKVRFSVAGNAAGFLAGGQRLLTTTRAAEATVWDAAQGTMLKRLTVTRPDAKPLTLQPTAGCLLITEQAKTDFQPYYRVVDVDTGMDLIRVPGFGDAMLSPNGTLLIYSPAEGGGAALANIATGKMVSRFGKGMGFQTEKKVLSADQKIILISGTFVTNLHDAATGKIIRRVNAFDLPDVREVDFQAAVFSPTGLFLAGVTADGLVLVVETSTGKAVRKFVGRSVAFSPDGKTLAVGTVQGSIILYQIASGKPLWSAGP